MKRLLLIVAVSQLLNFSTSQLLFAQKCINPHFETHRLDYRDLGYPGATEIPADDSPIVALLGHSNGKIYGATTGKRSHLFTYDYRVNKVFPLGLLAGEKGVHHCIAEGANGLVYIGTGLNEIELLTLTKDMPHGRRMIENQLWADIKAKYKDYAGGHLFVYDPKAGDDDTYLGDAPAKVKDFGIPVPGNSIYAMVAVVKTAPSGKILSSAPGEPTTVVYGISYPDAEFFAYDGKKFRRYGKWLEKLSYPGPERSWRGVPRGIVYHDGLVWSSGDDGLMRAFDTRTEKFVETTMRIPGEYWEQQNCNCFPVVEQILCAEEDKLIGTTSDGFVFELDTSERRLWDYGKPRVERRCRALTRGLDGRFYMICGEKDSVCRLFSVALDEGFRDWGVLGVDRSPYYAKIAYQFDSMCTGKDGSIYIGESDRRAKLFIFTPGGRLMDGVLNPTNPR